MLLSSKSRRFPTLIFPALTALLLALNVLLVVQNRALKAVPPTPASLLPARGVRINEIDGLSIDGSPIDIQFGKDHRKTMLFVFSTSCGVCTANWPNWEKLSKSVNPTVFRLAYANINSEMSKKYSDRYGLPAADVFAQLDARSRTQLNLQLTPLTIVLGADGTLERYWAGRLRPDEISQLQTVLLRGE